MKLQSTRVRAEFQRASSYYGIYSRIARELGVSPSHVRKVALGAHSSKRVERALLREIRRIEKLSAVAA